MHVARFCPRCGAENLSELQTCANCGGSLLVGAPQPPPPTVPPTMPAPTNLFPPPPIPLWSTMPPPMRRATIGTILGDTLSTFGKDIATYVLVYLVFGIAITLSTLLATATVFDAPSGSVDLPPTAGPPAVEVLYSYLAVVIVVAIVGLVIQSILNATLTVFAVHRHQGAAITFGEAWRRGLPKFVSVLGASLLPGLLLSAGLVAIVGLLLYGAATINLPLICGAGILLLLMIPVTIYITIALSLYAAPIVIEGKNAIEGLRRSWELTRGRRLTLFVVLLVLGLLIAVIGFAATVPFAIVANPYLASVGEIVSIAITGSWIVIMQAVAYNLILGSTVMPPAAGVPPTPWPPQ